MLDSAPMAKTILPSTPRPSRADKLTSEEPSPATAGTTTATTKPELDRLAVTLDAQGAIVFDGMRPTTKTRLRTALADPRVARELNLSAPAVGVATLSADDAALTMLVINALYDAVSGLGVAVARARGFHETSANLLRFTTDEKDKLAGPTMSVLNKYDLLGGKYKEEILLLVAIGSMTAGHVTAMQHAELEMSSGKAPAASSN